MASLKRAATASKVIRFKQRSSRRRGLSVSLVSQAASLSGRPDETLAWEPVCFRIRVVSRRVHDSDFREVEVSGSFTA